MNAVGAALCVHGSNDVRGTSHVFPGAVGGRWNPELRLWFVKDGTIAGGLLESHIHIDRSINRRYNLKLYICRWRVAIYI